MPPTAGTQDTQQPGPEMPPAAGSRDLQQQGPHTHPQQPAPTAQPQAPPQSLAKSSREPPALQGKELQSVPARLAISLVISPMSQEGPDTPKEVNAM